MGEKSFTHLQIMSGPSKKPDVPFVVYSRDFMTSMKDMVFLHMCIKILYQKPATFQPAPNL